MDDQETVMAGDYLPRVRELSGLTSTMVMLRSVGALLRVHYNDLLHEPLPKHFRSIVQQLQATI